jgi:hypothetical protein
MNDRRSFFKVLAAAPLLAAISSRELAAAVGDRSAGPYSSLGVQPLINARGTWTY